MARREVASLPQPPWVWGTSEVEEWIRGAYPAKGRRRTGERRGPAVVARLRVRIEAAPVADVRQAFVDALAAVGIRVAGRDAGPVARGPRHVAVASVHHALIGSRLRISARFEPPIQRSTCGRIVDRLSRAFRIVGVDAKERRARLPRKEP